MVQAVFHPGASVQPRCSSDVQLHSAGAQSTNRGLSGCLWVCRETALQQMTLNQTRRAQQQQQQQQSFLASNSQAVHSSTTLQQQQQQQPPGSGRSRSPLIQPATARPGPNDPAGLGGSCLQSSSSSSWHNSSVSAAAAMGAAAASKASAAPGQLLTKRTVMDSIVEVCAMTLTAGVTSNLCYAIAAPSMSMSLL